MLSSLLLVLLTITNCSNQEKAKVERMNLVEGVYASGNVKPIGYYEVTSKVPGVVDEILVSVGEQVKAGTPLIKLQNQLNEANLEIAKNQLELARGNASPDSDLITQLEQQTDNTQSIFRQDSTEYERFRSLREDSIGSALDLDRARLRYETSRNNHQIAVSKLRETRNRLQIEVDNARNHVIAQESLTGDYTIMSAIGGTVYDIIPKTGELIAVNRPIITIGSSDHFEAELQVDETDIILLKKGQTVYYELDAIDNNVLSGQVSLIYPRINTIERTAKVIASMNPQGYTLFPGMALEANIVVSEKDSVLVVPTTFISQDNEIILEDGSSKIVETGIRDLNYVEILSGLTEGEVVLKPES